MSKRVVMAVATALALAGCGGSPDREVCEEYTAAVKDADAAGDGYEKMSLYDPVVAEPLSARMAAPARVAERRAGEVEDSGVKAQLENAAARYADLDADKSLSSQSAARWLAARGAAVRARAAAKDRG